MRWAVVAAGRVLGMAGDGATTEIGGEPEGRAAAGRVVHAGRAAHQIRQQAHARQAQYRRSGVSSMNPPVNGLKSASMACGAMPVSRTAQRTCSCAPSLCSTASASSISPAG